MNKNITCEVATLLGKSRDDVMETVELFMELLHKKAYEYKGLNGDYIGEELHYDMSDKAFYHFLGFLNDFDDKYNWEQSASEYIARLSSRETWQPFSEQMQQWNKPTKD